MRRRSRPEDPAAPRSPRFGYHLLLERLLAYRVEAEGGAGGGGAHPAPDALDRRRVLQRLAAELGVEPAVLLERGFDKAYRRMVEGV